MRGCRTKLVSAAVVALSLLAVSSAFATAVEDGAELGLNNDVDSTSQSSGTYIRTGNHDGRYTLDNLVTGKVPRRRWHPLWALTTFAEDMEPVILTNTIATEWEAMEKWTPKFLRRHNNLETLENIKVSTDKTFFDLDTSAHMYAERANMTDFNLALNFHEENVTTREFFDVALDPHAEEKVYWFGYLAKRRGLRRDLEPNDLMWLNPSDEQKFYSTLWLSGAGPSQHTHFDSDHNFYVQIRGRKRFTLADPRQHEDLYMFPRIHPMWHKSQVDFDNPDLEQYPRYANVSFIEAVLEPGDLLYVPPYWWHHVEALTDSISVASWSKHNVFTAMTKAYEIGLYSDKQKTPEARRLSVKAETVLLLRAVLGEEISVASWIASLIETRYGGIEHHFKSGCPDDDCMLFCLPGLDLDEFADIAEVNIAMVAGWFRSIQPHEREINLADYLEILWANTVGADYVLHWLRTCFAEYD